MPHTAPITTAEPQTGNQTGNGDALVTTTPGAHHDDTRDTHAAPSIGTVTGTNDFAVSAADLIELIRSGHGADLNELVQRTLGSRRAA